MAGSATAARKDHHDLSMAVWTRQEENILKLKNVIASSMSPMTGECEDLRNVITNVVVPNRVSNQKTPITNNLRTSLVFCYHEKR